MRKMNAVVRELGILLIVLFAISGRPTVATASLKSFSTAPAVVRSACKATALDKHARAGWTVQY